MDAIARSRHIDNTLTDAHGEYEFHDVPLGNYVLYASLATDRQVMFWISDPIEVNARGTITDDFDRGSVTAVVWSATGGAALASGG